MPNLTNLSEDLLSRSQSLVRRMDSSYETYRTKRAEYLLLKRQRNKHAKQLKSLRTAQEIVQTIATTIQKQVHKQICELVSKCLATVFEEPYIFEIQFTKKRGKTDAQMKFTRNGNEVDPMEASGGGVVDVAAFALRVAAILVIKNIRRVVVMDEPFRFVALENWDRLKLLIKTLADDLDFQFIFVTHVPYLADIDSAVTIKL